MARSSDVILSVTPEACIGAAAILLCVPIPWIIAWFTAAAVHEICHCLILSLCRSSVCKITIGVNGAEIQTGELNELQTLLCSLAGPLGGLLLVLLARNFPRLALCALLQSAYNLLPVFPLDGGRVLRSFMRMMFPISLADRICRIIETTVCALLLLLGCVATFIWNLGILPVVSAAFFLLHTKKRKIPCK